MLACHNLADLTYRCTLSGVPFHVSGLSLPIGANLPAIHPALYLPVDVMRKQRPTSDIDTLLAITYWLRHSGIVEFSAPINFEPVTRPLWPNLLASICAIAHSNHKHLFPKFHITAETAFSDILEWTKACAAIRVTAPTTAQAVQAALQSAKQKQQSAVKTDIDSLQAAIRTEQQLIGAVNSDHNLNSRNQFARIAVKAITRAYDYGRFDFDNLANERLFAGNIASFMRLLKRVIVADTDSIHKIAGTNAVKFMLDVCADFLPVDGGARYTTAAICKILSGHLTQLAKIDAEFLESAGGLKHNRTVIAGVNIEFKEVDNLSAGEPYDATKTANVMDKLAAILAKRKAINL